MEEQNQEETKKCPKCKVPVENKACPICDMREIDMDDDEDYDRRERR